jgi:hypothetical protein
MNVRLSELSTIIHAPGEYIDRVGRKVIINEIKGGSSFEAKGVTVMQKGKRIIHSYNIWHVSGRCFPLNESNLDVVG